MSNIAIYSQKEIILASNQPRIKSLTKTFVGETIVSIINKTIYDSGMKVENPQALIVNVTDDVLKYFKQLTIEDIGIACRLGVRGELGDFMGINVRTIYSWLKKYSVTIRRDTLAEYARAQQIPKEATPEEKKIGYLKWLCECVQIPWQIFKDSGQYTFDDYGNILYDRLDEAKAIKFTSERKKEFQALARESYIVTQGLSKLRHPSIDISKNIRNAKSGKDNLTEEIIIADAKRLALRNFVEICKFEGIELPMLLNQGK